MSKEAFLGGFDSIRTRDSTHAQVHFLCKVRAKSDYFWGIWKILNQQWRKKCIAGPFEAK